MGEFFHRDLEGGQYSFMNDALPKGHPALSLLLKVRHRLKLRSRLAGLGLTHIPGSDFFKGILDRVSGEAGQILISFQGCKAYVDPMDVGIVPYLLADGVYESDTTDLFKNFLKPGMVVLDVGANFGYYGLIAAQAVGSAGKVYALEPEPNNFRLLVNNIELNGFSNVIPLQIALSNRNGKTTLFLDKTNRGAHSVRHRNINMDGGVAEIETITLDDFVQSKMETKRVDLIIMDVQGAEGLVIDGAEQTLRRSDVKILMEFWPSGLRNIGTDPQDLIRKLQEYGFVITVIDRAARDANLLDLAEMLENLPNKESAVNLLLEKISSRLPADDGAGVKSGSAS
jgi:FkbM family methyltransferase